MASAKGVLLLLSCVAVLTTAGGSSGSLRAEVDDPLACPAVSTARYVEREPRLPISPYRLIINLCNNYTVSDVSIFIARGDRGSRSVNLTDPSNWQVDFSRAKLKPCRVVIRANKGYAFKYDSVRYF